MRRTAVRPPWSSLPEGVRAGLAARAGGAVVEAVSQEGGFTHGVASRLRLGTGGWVFAKAIPVDDGLAGAYRNEARWAARLPATVPTPRLRYAAEVDGWLLLVFDDAPGRHPDLSSPVELAAVLSTVDDLAATLRPAPVDGLPSLGDALRETLVAWRGWALDGAPEDLDPWARRHLDRLALLEAGWERATAGDSMLHRDLRPDNLIYTATGRVLVVDWAHPATGAGWVDLVGMLASVPVDGLDPDRVLDGHPLTAGLERARVDAFVAALAGYYAAQCRRPAPPRSPNLRPHQARNATHAIAWLRRRTGWT